MLVASLAGATACGDDNGGADATPTLDQSGPAPTRPIDELGSGLPGIDAITPAAPAPGIPPLDAAAQVQTTSSGLRYIDEVVGTGPALQSGQTVTVNYTGWRSDGMMFDSSIARGQASTFPLDKVMAGWRECVTLMTIGETRRCWVPQALAYNGRAGRPTGTVVFDIELIDFRPSPLIPPPDVKAPPDDAKRTASGGSCS